MLTAENLLAPGGRVEAGAFFPDLDASAVLVRLTAYLEQGYAKATADGVISTAADRAVEHYVMSRVFEAVYLNAVANPLSSSTTEGGSASFSLAQIDAFRTMAVAELGAYGSLVPVSAATASARPLATVALKNRYNW